MWTFFFKMNELEYDYLWQSTERFSGLGGDKYSGRMLQLCCSRTSTPLWWTFFQAPIHIITVIVVLRNVSSTPLDTNPQICGPGISEDLAITNYGLFCHLTSGLGFPIGTLCIKNILADGTIAQLTYPAFLVACPEQHQAITILIIYWLSLGIVPMLDFGSNSRVESFSGSVEMNI